MMAPCGHVSRAHIMHGSPHRAMTSSILPVSVVSRNTGVAGATCCSAAAGGVKAVKQTLALLGGAGAQGVSSVAAWEAAVTQSKVHLFQ